MGSWPHERDWGDRARFRWRQAAFIFAERIGASVRVDYLATATEGLGTAQLEFNREQALFKLGVMLMF